MRDLTTSGDTQPASAGRDWVEEMLPAILTQFGPALTESAATLAATGHARLDLPAGRVDAEVAKTGLLRRRVLRIQAYRDQQRVMALETRITAGEVAEGLPSAVLHLAVAAANVLHETGR